MSETPRRPDARLTERVHFGASCRMRALLDMVVEMEGFGETRAEVARRFVWEGLNRLVEAKRLPEPSCVHFE